MNYLIVLTINIITLYLIRSDNKYWLISIPLWILLISGFIYWRIASDRQIQILETQYWKSPENKGNGDYDKWDKLKQVEKKAQIQNATFVNLIALQTLITFIIQILGQKQTGRRIYRWTKLIFGILSILAFLLIAMMGIVPSTGYMT